MTETFNVGDLVEAVKGEVTYRARTHAGFVTGEIQLTGVGSIDRLAEDGFTITVIEKALPSLPTERGYYFDKEGSVWRLHESGTWDDLEAACGPGELTGDRAPLTRLAPVAEVLGKVADRWDSTLTTFTEDLAHVAAQYGVTL